MFLKKFLSAVFAALIICSINFCEASKKIVAVMPLENVSGYNEEKVAEIMTEQLIVAIHSSGNYTVLERTQMATVLKEQGFQNIAGDPNKISEMGKLTGADYTLVGKVTMTVVGNNPTAGTVSKISNIFGLGDLGNAAGNYVDKFKSKIELEIRFVDNTTGEIIIAKTVEGSKSGATQLEALNAACKAAARDVYGIVAAEELRIGDFFLCRVNAAGKTTAGNRDRDIAVLRVVGAVGFGECGGARSGRADRPLAALHTEVAGKDAALDDKACVIR